MFLFLFDSESKLTLEQQNAKFAKALEEFHHTCDALETNIVCIDPAIYTDNFHETSVILTFRKLLTKVISSPSVTTNAAYTKI